MREAVGLFLIEVEVFTKVAGCRVACRCVCVYGKFQLLTLSWSSGCWRRRLSCYWRRVGSLHNGGEGPLVIGEKGDWLLGRRGTLVIGEKRDSGCWGEEGVGKVFGFVSVCGEDRGCLVVLFFLSYSGYRGIAVSSATIDWTILTSALVATPSVRILTTPTSER